MSKKNTSAIRSNLIICLLLPFFVLPTLNEAYLLLVDDSLQPGDVIFNGSISTLVSHRFYKINEDRSAPFVPSLIHVDPHTGQISLLEGLQCNGLHYPRLFTIYIDSTSRKLKEIDYYSLPLRIFIIGKDCPESTEYNTENIDQTTQKDNVQIFNFNEFSNNIKDKIHKAREWVSETYVSFPMQTAGKWQKLCLKRSQYIHSVKSFLPKSIITNCVVHFDYVSDNRFKIEQSQGDLVVTEDTCIIEPLWKVIIHFTTVCSSLPILNSEHRLKIIYHHEEFNDSDIARRVRRELRNQSPFFEQHLYVANVLEECDPPVIVTTVTARDPENNPIMYSMTSLLDSRTQAMFDIDSKTGVVSTKVQLDRELVDVHYFRVTVMDDSLPPRSGTTMLQINVLDANDHSPVFEMTEYDASVRESVSVGTTVITLKATDQDIGKNAEVEYSIQHIDGGGMSTEDEDEHAFKIDSKTGVITTRTVLDRETTEVYTLTVQASDLASPQTTRRSSTATVVIRILDDNDNYPQFSERTYTVSLNEDVNWIDNPVIAHIKATDADQGVNAAIRYAIISGNTQTQFSIDSLTGEVSLIKALDYETLRTYRLVIRAQDGGNPSRSNTTQLLINVKDVNDNAPRFYTSMFQENVLENVPIGYSILKVQAYDADEGLNAEILYTISSRDASGGPIEDLPLAVDSHSGWITTTKELDRELQQKYMFQVIASDQGVIPQSASASVIINVQDVNDNDPVFEPDIYEAVVAEDDSPGTPVATVIATDPDEDSRLHYSITSGNIRGRFAITSQSGRGLITIAQPLDYKQEKRYILTVTATDSGGKMDTATVYVNITDANNYSPVFENAPYSASIFEDAVVGTTVLVVSATDNDVGINAQITYSLGEDNGDSAFTINPKTGAIITTKLLDRETVAGYLLTVTARDGGNPPLSDTTDVEITVTDVNDNYPIFKQPAYSGSVPEDALIGTSVVQVSATDADVGLNGRIHYSLNEKDQLDGSFIIDPTSGVIRTNKGLDRESVALYELEAYAIDRGSPTLSSSVPVNIRIEDVNDSPPAFETEKIVFLIPENSPIGSTVGEIYAKDPDEGVNSIVQYSIIGGDDSQSFSLITRPGSDRAELLIMVELDYEGPKKKFDLIVRAASPPLRSDAQVEVIVTDVNDNAPVLKDFEVIFNNFKDCFPTGPIGKIPAFDADVSDKLHYKILSGNNANLVALNESTGQLQLSPQLNTNVPKIASMEVSVTDGINEVKAVMMLTVRLITEEMLLKSITVRLNKMTKEAFLSPLLGYFIDGLAAVIPCSKENIFLFNLQDDSDLNSQILNVSFSVRRPDVPKEEYYDPQYLQEKVYLNRAILTRISTVNILPFDDNLCVREPCLNYEECLTVLKFGNVSDFISSDTVLFRPIYPVTTFTCQCPKGFTGSTDYYLCDTEVNLCYSSPCKNNGTCMVKEGGYTCICPKPYFGKNCETKMENDTCKASSCVKEKTCNPKPGKSGFVCEYCDVMAEAEHYTPFCELKSRSFTKSSFLTFPSLKQRHRLHLGLRFATQMENGLLLYNGRYNEQHDFIALEIVDGVIQFSFSLGSEVTHVKATVPGGVSDGNWHRVTVNYFNKSATVAIDDCDTKLALKYGKELGEKWHCAGFGACRLEPRCASLTETCHRFLDLTGPLQLGGVPNSSNHFQIKNLNYEGCISDFEIDYELVNLNSFVTDNGTTAGCPEKRSLCVSRPCKNGGKCEDGWAMYKCVCPQGFGGRDCSENVYNPWHFAGSGMLSFNPLLRPIQLPWLNALSVRTLQEDTFLMSIQVGQNSSSILSLNKGHLTYIYNGEYLSLDSKYISDGYWHHLEVTWIGTEIKLSVDYGEREVIIPFKEKIQGLYIGKILIGGPDNSYTSLGHNYLEGCVQDVRIGNKQTILNMPTVKENVENGCFSTRECHSDCPSSSECIIEWGKSHCECNSGHVGPLCLPVCSVNPCDNGGTCIADNALKRGYKCNCNETEFTGEACDMKKSQPCPSSWWGYPVCGPCQCDVEAGYNPDCDKKTGKCHCKDNHYQLSGNSQCIPCDCYHVGSYSTQCNHETGQCKCKEGVIGLKCDSCPNNYAEVTLKGCEVVYDGCPRSRSDGIWWPRTLFGAVANESCPKGSQGKVSRICDSELGGWQDPDMFNCTSDKFIDLREQLANIETGKLQVNTFVAIKLANDLQRATNKTKELYGADVLVVYDLIKELLLYESKARGLNLTHSQDKNYINNLVHSVGVVISKKYISHWRRIKVLTGEGIEDLIGLVEKYIKVLSLSQHDTYTSPFEIVSSNMVMGLDVITSESVYGFELEKTLPVMPSQDTYPIESVMLPDTSLFLEESESLYFQGPLIAFPKYNNYLLDKAKFDQNTRILIPLSLLGIKPVQKGEILTKHSMSEDGAVITYAEYKEAGAILPKKYDESVLRRWGVDITIGSPILSVSVLIPEYVHSFSNATKRGPQKHSTNADLSHANVHRFSRDVHSSEKQLVYKSLSEKQLPFLVRLQLWLDPNITALNERSNPQCVHWSMERGGEWSRVGCRTELDDDWYDKSDEAILVNCSCNIIATFAVLVDVVDHEFIPEPSFLEDVMSYSCFSLSLPLLLGTYLILALIRGTQTNSNTIRKNLVFCVFFAELMYFIALKVRKIMVENEFQCKLVAIVLHYFWLASFCWMLVDGIHLYRMLTEMRDINHGPMRFYYSIGYVFPAIVVSLAVGVRAHQYGNYYFCWVSLYESVVWSLVGPICTLITINFVVLIFSIRAAFAVQDHVLGFGNLRTLLWVSVFALPLLGATWVLALLDASEKHPLLTPCLSTAVLIHAGFCLGGYCFANSRVRQNLMRSILRCMGKKVPLLETASVAGVPSTSSQNVQAHSALAYHSTLGTSRRNIGISTSSTTSRSTTKTSSSPYRSDTHLRHTSTSTSNYNSTSDGPSYLRGYDHEPSLVRHREILEENGGRDNGRADTDSDSDGSEGRSLELASSHSSDEEDSSAKMQRIKRTNANTKHGYLPNITENVPTTCGTPPSLNIVKNSQLFPAVPPNSYGGRWSSQLPESYLPHPTGPVGRWSLETVSDNELNHKKNSPNPLPNPDGTLETVLSNVPTEHYMVHAQYDNRYGPNAINFKEYSSELIPNDNMSYHEYGDRYSDMEEKHQMHDKYLFPYTGISDDGTWKSEEDHVSVLNYVPPLPPMMSPENNMNISVYDQGSMVGSRLGSRKGSLLGSNHGSTNGSSRGSPSMFPSSSMIHSRQHSEYPQ